MDPYLEIIIKHYGIIAGWLVLFLFILFRYVLFAGTTYFIMYKWRKTNWFRHKIQPKFPNITLISQEILHSIHTIAIFAGMSLGVYWLRQKGYGSLYFDIGDYGWSYFFFSIGCMIAFHDTYFYWTHRLMHHPKLFQIFHKVHHQSPNPTPYTAFSFHPLEAIVEFGIIPLIALAMPIHAGALLLFTLWSMFFNVMGHSGYEIFPSGFTKHPVFKWMNTATHHNLHHSRSGANYSLYFNFWDRIMGTNHPQYDEIFEKVKKRSQSIADAEILITKQPIFNKYEK